MTSTRQKLGDTRPGVTHRFSIGGETGYITIGEYDDGRPGEVFVTIDKEGSLLSGFADAWAIAISIALQHGVPLDAFTAKFKNMRFEPQGVTGQSCRPIATSIPDYLAHWLEQRYGQNENSETD